jgi:hypothetical protein
MLDISSYNFDFKRSLCWSVLPIFWDIKPCSMFKVNRRLGGTFRLHLQSRRTSQPWNQHGAGSKQAWFLARLSADFQRTTRHCIPEDSTLLNHNCDNLKFNIIYFIDMAIFRNLLSHTSNFMHSWNHNESVWTEMKFIIQRVIFWRYPVRISEIPIKYGLWMFLKLA